jgi:predicted transport protein
VADELPESDLMKNYTPAKLLSMKTEPTINEKWIQDQIEKDPSILGLGDDLQFRDRERRQPRAGRLDLLFEDDDRRRYEVEIQLGATDESHVIRTIEYWDIERRRYPQYDHCAVIVAEDITSRFLNVISLFNGHIPLVAIKMQALEVGAHSTLVFTKVLDEIQLGFDEEDQPGEPTDRSYWEKTAAKDTVKLVDRLLEHINELLATSLELNFNKQYIGIYRGKQPFNFVIFRPRKKFVNLDIRLDRSEDTDQELDNSDFDVMPYDKQFGNYRLRLTQADVEEFDDLLQRLLKDAYERRGG